MRFLTARIESPTGGKDLSCRSWRSRAIASTMLAGTLLLFAGCQRGDRPELGQVRGTVTLAGKPLSNVQVVFHPPKGRISYATTDSDGHYNLIYLRDDYGAIVGKHRVQIAPLVPEDAPRYVAPTWSKKIMQKEVVAGKNEINFDLK
jgi:hypothetical protein